MEQSEEDHVEIQLVKKDIKMLEVLCDKYGQSLDKLQEIAASISRMVSLLEQRIDLQEKSSTEVQRLLEMRRIEHDNDIKDVHDRITRVNADVTSKMDKMESNVMAELHEIRKEIAEHRKDNNAEEEALNKRLIGIETWRWMIIGVIIFLGYILSKVDFLKYFHSVFHDLGL